jgi:hypothetical protein
MTLFFWTFWSWGQKRRLHGNVGNYQAVRRHVPEDLNLYQQYFVNIVIIFLGLLDREDTGTQPLWKVGSYLKTDNLSYPSRHELSFAHCVIRIQNFLSQKGVKGALKIFYTCCLYLASQQHAVAQWAEALRYKPEGRGFDSRSFRSHYGPGIDSSSNRNEYQDYFLGGKRGRCIGLTTLPPSSADCLEIWEPQPSGTLRTCPGL